MDSSWEKVRNHLKSELGKDIFKNWIEAICFNKIERDFKLGGEISLVFWLIGGFFTLFFGYITDIVSRKKLLIVSMLFGEIPCFLTGFVETYQQFF